MTALVAPPRSGKTWTLLEVARRLTEENQFIVGYYELKGGEPSHLLFAASDLYARWLHGASMREQAKQLWLARRGGLISQVGELTASVFEKLCDATVPLTGALIRKAFDGLAAGQAGLASGGITLQSLAYDQVLSLTRLVAAVTQKRIVLMLDAWEQSPSKRQEFQLLQTILRHQEDWEHAHFFLGIRSPDIVPPEDRVDAIELAQILAAFDASATLYQLPEIDLALPAEQLRAVQAVHEKLPFTRRIPSSRIVAMISGHPGVFYHWFNRDTRLRMLNEEDLAREAAAAHGLRYPDLHRLLDPLAGPKRDLVSILAFLPRLNEVRWTILRKLIEDTIGGSASELIDALVDAGVLEDSPYPTLGHDTRHQAVRRWFATKQSRYFRAQAERLILDISSVTSIDRGVRWTCWETIAASAASLIPNLNEERSCIVHAACLANNIDSTMGESVFARRYREVANSGLARANLIYGALFSRAVRRHEAEQFELAIADFTECMQLPAVPPSSMASLYYNRGICHRRREQLGPAIEDYSRCIESGAADIELHGMALNNRGMALRRNGNSNAALESFDACIALPGVLARQLATALIRRASIVSARGDLQDALADLERCIAIPDVPSDRLREAIADRDLLRNRLAQHAT
jgi:tetratricopeptide (TPR) repeat protein